MWPKMWSILENVPCALEKKVYSSAFGWSVLKISTRSISSNVSFKTSLFLLIFCFEDLSIGVTEVLTSPTIIVLLSISPFLSVSVCLCIEVLLCWMHRYLQLLCLPLGLIPWSLCSVLPYLLYLLYFKVYFVWYEDCHSSFLLLPICMEYTFRPLTFSLYMSLGLKCVPSRQHIYGFCFCIPLASLYLLVGAFNPFTFKVIIDIYVPIAIFLIVWGWFDRSFFFYCIS